MESIFCHINVLERYFLVQDWLSDQNYSLYDTYGEEFGDLIADIPDPIATPANLINEFLYILAELGIIINTVPILLLYVRMEVLGSH